MKKLIAISLLVSANAFAMGAKPGQSQALDTGLMVLKANAGTLVGSPAQCAVVIDPTAMESQLSWKGVASIETNYPELWTQTDAATLVYAGGIRGEEQTWTIKFAPQSLRLIRVSVVLKDLFHQEVHTCNF